MSLLTPGVYLREVDVAPPPRASMSVAGFVGQAERGPVNLPQVLTSWGQYRDVFGDFIGHGYLPYAVFGFFLNGGERCHVVRVAHQATVAARATLPARARPDQQSSTQQPSAAIGLEAISPGAWGNAVSVTAEAESSRDILLTRLAADAPAGQPDAALQSVAGLAVGDRVTLIHPQLADAQKLTLAGIDVSQRRVTFVEQLRRAFPVGSSVLGRGFRLRVRYEPGGQLVREEVFDDLSLDERGERYFVEVINGPPEAVDFVQRMRQGYSILVRVTDPGANPAPDTPRPEATTVTLGEGADAPNRLDWRYFTGYDGEQYFEPDPPPRAPTGPRGPGVVRWGLAALEPREEIGLVAIPDLALADLFDPTLGIEVPPDGLVFAEIPPGTLPADRLVNLRAGQLDLLRHCERLGDRFAILDSPRGAEVGRGASRIEDWPSSFQFLPSARNAALYYPWIQEQRSDFGGRELLIPPSGHVAGIYARSESERGVGRAPANELLHGIVNLEACLSDAEQAVLNPRGINCLRALPGRGLRVWGARTLSLDPRWRYVNIRRVGLTIVKQILTSLQWTVFEPNDRRLWNRIVATLTLLLRDLFLSGALAGSTAAEAFGVRCDETTNPPESVALGRVITEVRFAPARPAEFIVVTITRTAESISAREQAPGGREGGEPRCPAGTAIRTAPSASRWSWAASRWPASPSAPA
jgi:phage tail sheath protein FI